MPANKKVTTTGRRNRIAARHRAMPGAPPGALRVDPEAPKPDIRVVSYDESSLDEKTLVDLEELPAILKARRLTWIDVMGLGSEKILLDLKTLLGLDELAIEDVVNENQRSKVELQATHGFAVLNTLGQGGTLPTEQLSLFWGDRWVLTFQPRASGRLDAVRARIREGRTRIRERGPDYLAYCLMDVAVDAFVPVVDRHLDELTHLEEEILGGTGKDVIQRLSAHKHDLVALRRAVAPLHGALDGLLRASGSHVDERTRPFLRDVLDHAMQLSDLIESARDLASGLLNVHLSMVGFRSGETMRVLTVIATIFIPLTFLVGIWGMNFKPEASPFNMPELGWRWGYPAALGLMLVTTLGMLVYFWRKGWLGGGRE